MSMNDNRLARFLYPGLNSDTPPSLKDVFDNLRNYPILAVMSAATSLLPANHTNMWQMAMVFWVIFLILLLLAAAFQTALVLVHCFGYFFGNTRFFQSKWGNGIAIVIALSLFFVGVIGGFEIAIALNAVRAKS